jgi:hypothetical protein
MTAAQGRSPNSAEVEAHILRAERKHPDLVAVEKVAVTAEKRPLYAVTVTDGSVADTDKQHVLVAAGHHGSEESGRLVALALIGWLVSAAAEETRARQKIVIMPNMSPDSAEADTYLLPGDVSVMRDHAPGGPKTPEGKAFEKIADRLQPEVYVDMHARGGSGCSYDMVLWSEPITYSEDDYLLHKIAAEMGDAGERAGIPHLVHPLSWPGFMSESPDATSANAFCYRRYKSLSFLTETAESNEFAFPARDRARSGLARIRALLARGNRRHPKLRYEGYPCYLAGMFEKGLVAVGKTAAARRRSRVDIWRNFGKLREFKSEVPERPDLKRLRVDYRGARLSNGVGFQTLVRGRRMIDYVKVNGTRLRQSETHGYCGWHHGCSTFVVVAAPDFGRGKYEILIAHSPAG